MDAFTSGDLRRAVRLIADHAERVADSLTEADGKLGDGDLGITVSRGWRECADASDRFPDDVGLALLECAKGFQRASPSSFGTLTATALMSAAKQCKGKQTVDYGTVAALLDGARAAMQARGKGQLGDKTVLDVLDAMATAAQGQDSAADLLAAVQPAVEWTIADFRGKPNKLGRARMFGDASIGLDDPGMLAVRETLNALSGAEGDA